MQNDSWCFLGAVLSAIVGYYIRSVVNSKSADRKEDRERIDKLISEIDEVETYSNDYFLLSPSDEGRLLHSKIIRKLKLIGRETHALGVTFGDQSISQFQLQLKQKITLGDFESTNRLPRNKEDPLFEEIADCSRRLIGQMELSFNKKYRKNCVN